MRKISAKIVADSINPQGNRITTMLLTYPRFIHGEVLTHRVFSKNSASSRAIPFNKMKEMVMNDPFIPIAWQKDHKGMQGAEYWESTDNLNPIKNSPDYSIDAITHFKNEWLAARDAAMFSADHMSKMGLTKQLCNRILEPFMWHTVLLTATEFENFFNLRCPIYTHPYDNSIHRSKSDFDDHDGDILEMTGDGYFAETFEHWQIVNTSQAEIHIQALAESMWDAMNKSSPQQLESGEWHIPYGDNMDIDALSIEEHLEKLLKVSTARCARLSYQTVGDNPKIDYDADIRLHDILLNSKHFSPFEHCQRAMTEDEYESFIKGNVDVGFDIPEDVQGWCDNMRGFISYRYLLENNLPL